MRRRTTEGRGSDLPDAAMPVVLGLVVVVAACGGGSSAPGADPNAGDASRSSPRSSTSR